MLDKKCKMCLKEGMVYDERGSVDRHVVMGHCGHCGALVRKQTKPMVSMETWLNIKDEVLVLNEAESDGYWDKHAALNKALEYLKTNEVCTTCHTGHVEPYADLSLGEEPTPLILYRKCGNPDCASEPVVFTDDESDVRVIIDCLRGMENPIAVSLSVLYEARLLGFKVHDDEGHYLDIDFLAQQIMEHANDHQQ